MGSLLIKNLGQIATGDLGSPRHPGSTIYIEDGVIRASDFVDGEALLDELPELFNVLKGDLSLVGPRPLLMEYLPRYSAEQARRHDVKPGITGWAQVNGRNAINWDQKFKLDVWYVDNQSFRLDCRILWLTLVKVLKKEGITQKGHVTMEKFKGNGRNI